MASDDDVEGQQDEGGGGNGMIIELLPPEVLTHVLHYLNIAGHITLASCSQKMQHRVYRDCIRVWKCINFGHVPRVSGHD